MTFLTSSWRCIFGQGCQGVLTEPAPELVAGLLLVRRARVREEGQGARSRSSPKQLGDDEWQFKTVGMKKGVWKNGRQGRVAHAARTTDACVFLNRPGFEAGPGCALHLHAMNTGKHFSETKPTVCWQLPLRAFDRDEEDESITSVLTEFGRDGWGEGGEEFALVVHGGARGVHRARARLQVDGARAAARCSATTSTSEVAKYLRRAHLEPGRRRCRIRPRSRSRSGARASGRP